MKRFVLIITAILCLGAFTACSSKEDKENSKQSDVSDSTRESFNTQSIMTEIKENFEFSDMSEYNEPVFIETLYGVSQADIKQCSLLLNQTGTVADEIVIIEAVDSDAAGRIIELVTGWYTSKAAQMKDYIPEEYEKITGCSVKNNGNIVYMVIADNNKEIEEIIEKYL